MSEIAAMPLCGSCEYAACPLHQTVVSDNRLTTCIDRAAGVETCVPLSEDCEFYEAFMHSYGPQWLYRQSSPASSKPSQKPFSALEVLVQCSRFRYESGDSGGVRVDIAMQMLIMGEALCDDETLIAINRDRAAVQAHIWERSPIAAATTVPGHINLGDIFGEFSL